MKKKIANQVRYCLFILVIMAGVYFAFTVSNRDTPVRFSYKSVREYYSIFPQGWAFFTRNPREAVLKIYRQENGRLVHLNSTASLSLGDALGLKRHKRKISTEFAQVISRVAASKWTKFDTGDIEEKAKGLPIADTIESRFDQKLLQGEYVFYQSERVPWAWAASNPKMPFQCIKIFVK
jgi:antimicrobial peptide system SdpA family protein